MMQDLIRRLEYLAAPDRKVDGLVHTCCTGEEVFGQGLATGALVPPYTASIETALTLMPEGWEWAISYEAPGKWREEIYRVEVGDPEICLGGEHKVGAIALCIAALRARMALTAGKSQ